MLGLLQFSRTTSKSSYVIILENTNTFSVSSVALYSCATQIREGHMTQPDVLDIAKVPRVLFDIFFILDMRGT